MSERAVRKVYAVSSGTYSDYQVHWLFERMEDAEVVAAERTADMTYGMEVLVEEFYLYGPGERPKMVSEWEVQVDLQVDAAVIPELSRPYEHKVLEESVYRRPELQEWKTQVGATVIRGRGGNREAVIKAVKDRAARVVAGA